MVDESENINSIRKIIKENYENNKKNQTSFIYAGIPFDVKSKVNKSILKIDLIRQLNYSMKFIIMIKNLFLIFMV